MATIIDGGAVAFATMALSHMGAVMTRLAISRSRELMADAGAVELTKDADALISALLKISGNDHVPVASEGLAALMISASFDADDFVEVLFSTHPTVEARVAALAQHAGGIASPRARGRVFRPRIAQSDNYQQSEALLLAVRTFRFGLADQFRLLSGGGFGARSGFGPRRNHRGYRDVGVVEDLGVEHRYVTHQDRMTDRQIGNINRDRFRQVARQHSDGQRVQGMLQYPTSGSHPFRDSR